MKGKSTTKLIIMFAFFVFISAFDLSVNHTSAQTCGENADKEIVETIYAKIKGNSKLAGQETHINVISANKVVKLQGWANNAADRATIYNYAMGTPCVVMVNDKDFLDKEPTENLRSSCGANTTACGEVCVPAGDPCNIGTNTKNEE